MKLKKTIKFRKEDFGWLVCDIDSCNVYLICDKIKEAIDFIKNKEHIEDIKPEIVNEINKFGLLEK